MTNPTTRFCYLGFQESGGTRILSYEVSGTNGKKTVLTVAADLALASLYHIRIQELPLLCRSVLDGNQDFERVRSYTLSEQHMRLYAERNAPAVPDGKRKSGVARGGQKPGAAWRTLATTRADGWRR